MASDGVVNLVRSLARDSDAAKLLRLDPGRLVAKHRLGAPAVAVLEDVDRFFKTEQPILQAAVRPRVAEIPRSPSSSTRPAPPLTDLVVSSDTGTLLPGPNTGTFSASGSAFGTALAPAIHVPAPRPPAPQIAPAPGVSPAFPGPWTPFAPTPAMGPAQRHPVAPQAPFPGWTPMVPTSPKVSPGQPPSAGAPLIWNAPAVASGAASPPACDCEVAVVAITGLVATLAQTSLTAIAAIAPHSRTRHGA